MNKYLIGFTVVIIFLVGAYYLLFTNPEVPQVVETPTSTARVLKIGALVPLSGDYAVVGESALAGAQLAAKEINEAGGVNGTSIEIVFEDDQCTKDGGIAATTKLVVVDEADALIGSICSSSSESAATVSQAAGVSMLITGASMPELTKAGEYIFRISPSAMAQGKFAADFLYKDLSKTKVAVVYGKDDWNQVIAQSFLSTFKGLGGKVLFEGSLPINASTKEIEDMITKIKSAKSDYIYVTLLPPANSLLVKKLEEAKLKTPVLEVAPKYNNLEEFNDRVKDLTGKDPNAFTPLFYDAARMLANVMVQAGSDKKTIRNNLVTYIYDSGVSSIIEFDDKRELKSPSFEVKGIPSVQSSSSSVSSTTQ